MSNGFINFFSNRALLFELLNQAAKNVTEMATQLAAVLVLENETERALVYKQIDKMENTGDDITHKIYLLLDKLPFAPLNKNDVHTLASTIDDIADSIQEASGRMYLYNIADFSTPIKEISLIILKACIQIQKAVELLVYPKKNDSVLEISQLIKTYERQADTVYYHAVASLFSNEKDPIKLLKYREIFLSVETTVNKCKNVADTLSIILINK